MREMRVKERDIGLSPPKSNKVTSFPFKKYGNSYEKSRTKPYFHRITEYQVGRNTKDHLVPPFMAKALS